MRCHAAALRRASGTAVALVAIGLFAVTTACAADGSADPAEVASESPTVPTATRAAPTAPSPTPVDTPSSTSTSAPEMRPSTSAIATTRAGDVAAVRLALQAARDRWRAASVQTYEHEYAVRCDCEPLAATVRVLGGRVLGAVAGRGLEMSTVVEWFDVVAGAIDTADAVEVDFDDDLGHPLHLLVDPDGSTTGDEYGIDTTAFRVVDDPVRRWFTNSWGCGYQLVAATPDQTAALVLQVGAAAAGSTGRAEPADIGALATAELRFGADLMAGWCDDVLPPGATTPALDATWTLTGGTLDLAVDRRWATGDARALVATTPGGVDVALGSVELRNDAWGSSAG